MKIPLSRSCGREFEIRLRKKLFSWHACFALFPVVIPQAKYDELVVPRHLLWLEWFEVRGFGSGRTWWRHREIPADYERRTYRDAPTLRALAAEEE